MKRTCLQLNTNTNDNSKHGVLPMNRDKAIRLLKLKLFTDENKINNIFPNGIFFCGSSESNYP